MLGTGEAYIKFIVHAFLQHLLNLLVLVWSLQLMHGLLLIVDKILKAGCRVGALASHLLF